MISPGCKHCYAETFAERFRGVKGHTFELGFDIQLCAHFFDADRDKISDLRDDRTHTREPFEDFRKKNEKRDTKQNWLVFQTKKAADLDGTGQKQFILGTLKPLVEAKKQRAST
jgi:hypothetical protein